MPLRQVQPLNFIVKIRVKVLINEKNDKMSNLRSIKWAVDPVQRRYRAIGGGVVKFGRFHNHRVRLTNIDKESCDGPRLIVSKSSPHI